MCGLKPAPASDADLRCGWSPHPSRTPMYLRGPDRVDPARRLHSPTLRDAKDGAPRFLRLSARNRRGRCFERFSVQIEKARRMPGFLFLLFQYTKLRGNYRKLRVALKRCPECGLRAFLHVSKSLSLKLGRVDDDGAHSDHRISCEVPKASFEQHGINLRYRASNLPSKLT